LEEAGWPW
jgi:hypothetical protein